MKSLGIIGGVLGIIISLVCQLFAIIDDSYTFGNIGLLGILSGVLAIVGAILIKRNNKIAIILLLISIVTGIIAISYFYILAAVVTLITIVLVFKSIFTN